mgnify:CR=1 FL=1
MRKVILQQFVTIDGFAADTDGGMRFQQDYVSKNDKSFQEDALRFLDTVDTMVLGANTYNMFAQYWPGATGEEGEFAQKLNSLSKVVASSTLKSAPWGEWEAAEITDNPSERLAQLRQQKGKDIVIWGSLALTHSLMKEGWIDEYQLRVCPAATGSGKPLFPRGSDLYNLKLLETKSYDKGMVLLRYEPE